MLAAIFVLADQALLLGSLFRFKARNQEPLSIDSAMTLDFALKLLVLPNVFYYKIVFISNIFI